MAGSLSVGALLTCAASIVVFLPTGFALAAIFLHVVSITQALSREDKAS